MDRLDRMQGALNQIYASPFGSGWSTAGWVHSDFLQVAVNLGLIAGIIFFLGYVFTLLRLGQRLLPYLRSGEHSDLGFSLLLSFVAAGGLLAMEGVEVLPQFVLPVWFVWVMVEVWLQQTPDLRKFYAAPLIAYPDQVGALDYRAV
jgi:O-antigen ligase